MAGHIWLIWVSGPDPDTQIRTLRCSVQSSPTKGNMNHIFSNGDHQSKLLEMKIAYCWIFIFLTLQYQTPWWTISDYQSWFGFMVVDTPWDLVSIEPLKLCLNSPRITWFPLTHLFAYVRMLAGSRSYTFLDTSPLMLIDSTLSRRINPAAKVAIFQTHSH